MEVARALGPPAMFESFARSRRLGLSGGAALGCTLSARHAIGWPILPAALARRSGGEFGTRVASAPGNQFHRPCTRILAWEQRQCKPGSRFVSPKVGELWWPLGVLASLHGHLQQQLEDPPRWTQPSFRGWSAGSTAQRGVPTTAPLRHSGGYPPWRILALLRIHSAFLLRPR